MASVESPFTRDFYARDPDVVARELLGKIVIRRVGSDIMSGRIVETEAYYGDRDPASRAYKGRKNYNRPMFGEPGRLFVYMVHSWWLLNVVAHREDEVGAVLIRALEPLGGVEAMMRHREVTDIYNLTNGPGKLSKALAMTNEHNGIDITDPDSELVVVGVEDEVSEIGYSHRIGVTEDLPEELRFFVKGNRFVSR